MSCIGEYRGYTRDADAIREKARAATGKERNRLLAEEAKLREWAADARSAARDEARRDAWEDAHEHDHDDDEPEDECDDDTDE